ncbi:ABC transporter permease [Pseudomonas sp. NFR16]|uniref:ABC transporter permease n=1 Tax=Pseudomonas sp. NFR16 TaxID=1566248 RepID=UPI0008B29A8A|nr:ABC transporter permease subunit [Pseudomonas sp. NFR16]SEJ83190.1 NitT/TauT family transport system permease protein [Pseudomonas sp. NFR16]
MNIESVLRALLVAGFIGLIELLCRTHVIPQSVLIAPSQMLTHLASVVSTGVYGKDILFSFTNIAVAALLAIVSGFLVGLAVHSMPRLRAALEPLLASYYAVPTFIFYPVFIVVFGVGHGSIIAIAVLLAVVAMITATLTGLDRIPGVLRKSAVVMRMSRLQTAWRIELPAALPYLFGGVKLSVAYAFIGVIASEFILSGSGIGYAIAFAYNNFESDNMYALMLLVLISVTLINAALNYFDRRLQARRQR